MGWQIPICQKERSPIMGWQIPICQKERSPLKKVCLTAFAESEIGNSFNCCACVVHFYSPK